MPLTQSDKDFLAYIDKKIKSGKPLSGRPSNLDKATSKYLINTAEDTTWLDVYNRALANYMNEGGTEGEAATLAPHMTGRLEKRKIKEEATATKQALKEQAILDPFGATISPNKLSVSTDPNNGRTYVSGLFDPKSDAAGEFFIWTGMESVDRVVAKGRKIGVGDKDTVTTATSKYDEVRKLVLEDAVKNKTEKELFDALYNAGSISKEVRDSQDVSSQDFNKGLQYALRNYSVSTMDNYNLKGFKEAQTFMDYLNKDFGKDDAGTTKTVYDSVITKRSDAADEADYYFMQWLGRGATKQEEDDYYKMLRAEEKKSVIATTTSYDADGNKISGSRTGEALTDIDRVLLVGKVAGRALKGSDVDTLLKSGGSAARDVQSLMTYAQDYGVRLSQDDAMKYVAQGLRRGTDIKANKSKILEISKAQYSNLSNILNDSVSISDLAANYKYAYGQTLEVSPDSVDMFDPYIQKAMMNDGKSGMMSLTDFNKVLRQDARWANTKNAKEEASNYAYSILNSFGLMA